MVEIPEFVNFLTTSKTDFIRARKRRQFERLYDPIRQAFREWLRKIGVQSLEVTVSDEARSIERELRRLTEEVPELAEFFGFRNPTKVLVDDNSGEIPASFQEGVEGTFPVGEGGKGQGEGVLDVGDEPGETLVANDETPQTPSKPISRTSRRGPKITIVEASDRLDMAWVDGDAVCINSGHPSYARNRNASARRLHCLFAVGNAVQRFMIESGDGEDTLFVDRMMAAWGRR